jgi:hypothetical protein
MTATVISLAPIWTTGSNLKPRSPNKTLALTLVLVLSLFRARTWMLKCIHALTLCLSIVNRR